MISCKECEFFTPEPRPELPPASEGVQGEEQQPQLRTGVCRRLPPQSLVQPQAAFFGPLQLGRSKLDVKGDVPGWHVVCLTYSTFPTVVENWGCGEGREPERKLEQP